MLALTQTFLLRYSHVFTHMFKMANTIKMYNIKMHSITIDKQQKIDLQLYALTFKVGKYIIIYFFHVEI
jgi:hypothetical protein